MKPTIRTMTCFMIMAGLALVAPVAAQDQRKHAGWSGMAEEQRPELSPADRDRAAHGIVERWVSTAASRGYPLESWRGELLRLLRSVDSQRIARAAEAGSYGEMMEILTGKNTDRIYEAPSALGDKGIDLNFFPITPCRVLDTRFGTGVFAGPRSPGTTTSFVTNFTSNIVAQGGNPAGCPLPAVDAGAIAFNLTVTNNNTDGFATMFPATAPLPNASTINYGPGSFPSPLANASIVQQCVTCGNDVSVYVEGASTHVIVDVVGYFDLAPTVECVANRTTDFPLGNNVCQNVVSCSLSNPANGRTRVVQCMGNISTQINHTNGQHDSIAMNIDTANNVCDAFPWEGGTAVWDLHASLPTGCCWNQSVTAQNRFTLAAGASQSYFLNVLMYSGQETGDDIDAAQLICTLLP